MSGFTRRPAPSSRPQSMSAWARAGGIVGLFAAIHVGIATAALPMVVTSVAERIAAVERAAGHPLRYAVGLTPSQPEIDLASGGVDVFSAGAVSLGMRLSASNWPAGATLIWRAVESDVIHRIDASSGTIWLPDVAGETARLEWNGAELLPHTRLHIDHITHGYRGLNAPTARASGDAGSCNVDAVCPQGNDWNESIRASVLITVDDTSTSRASCSGALLNNTADDNRPLMITARHCGINADNADSVIAIFNYQRSVCGGSNNGSRQQQLSGARWLTEAPRADTTLIELSRSIPITFNAHLGGWHAERVAPQFGITAHHAAADQKKISLYMQPAQIRDGVVFSSGLLDNGFTADTWRVVWSTGITEPGSSGSGLWNENQRLMGVLSGGGSSCSLLGGTNGSADFFGRLDVAWDDSAALRTALDPIGGGTQRTGCGRDNRAAPCTTIQTPTPTPTVTPTATPTPTPTPIATPSPSPSNPSGNGNASGGSGGGGGAVGYLPLLLLGAVLLVRRRYRTAFANG